MASQQQLSPRRKRLSPRRHQLIPRRQRFESVTETVKSATATVKSVTETVDGVMPSVKSATETVVSVAASVNAGVERGHSGTAATFHGRHGWAWMKEFPCRAASSKALPDIPVLPPIQGCPQIGPEKKQSAGSPASVGDHRGFHFCGSLRGSLWQKSAPFRGEYFPNPRSPAFRRGLLPFFRPVRARAKYDSHSAPGRASFARQKSPGP